MVDVQKVEGLIRNLATYVGHLHDIARTEREAFLKDAARVGGAKYYLQISIEACLNLGNHIIATERFRAPKDYRDIFNVLNEMRIILLGSQRAS